MRRTICALSYSKPLKIWGNENVKCKVQNWDLSGRSYKGRMCSFSRKRTKKLLSLGFVRILRKFSIKCEHFIGFEASILPFCAST